MKDGNHLAFKIQKENNMRILGRSSNLRRVANLKEKQMEEFVTGFGFKM